MINKEKQFVFTGPFKDYCPRYVSYKRDMGFKFGESALYSLRHMDDYFKQYNLSSPGLTKRMVEDYVSHREGEADKTQHMRMCFIRQFALFMNRLGFDFYVYPDELVPIAKTFTPYIFTHDEIKRILNVVDHLACIPQSKYYHKYYHLIYPMLFRMLYGCGLRINEALSLKKPNVDLVNGILTITKAKNSMSRLVPMSWLLTDYCRRYAKNMGFDMSDDGYFYPSRDAGKYNTTTVYIKFKKFMKQAGIFTDGSVGPRVHDMRHYGKCLFMGSVRPKCLIFQGFCKNTSHNISCYLHRFCNQFIKSPSFSHDGSSPMSNSRYALSNAFRFISLSARA